MLHAWDNFFNLAGQAAATLMGLIFVAVTVVTGFSTSRIMEGARGFLTPTLVHFGIVLLQVLALLAPWSSAWPLGIVLGLLGLAGLGYQVKAIFTRQQVGSDLLKGLDLLPWLGVPALGYTSMIVGAVGLIARKSFAPYAMAGATMLLLFAGAYAAWDLTLWIVTNRDKT
jgi:hypothetical protein